MDIKRLNKIDNNIQKDIAKRKELEKNIILKVVGSGVKRGAAFNNIDGGTETLIPFFDSTGRLAEDSSLNFNSSTDTLSASVISNTTFSGTDLTATNINNTNLVSVALTATSLTATTIVTNTPKGYAEMYMYDNATACGIDTANVYHAIFNTWGNNDGTLAPQQDSTYFTYKAGIGYGLNAFADYNAPTSTLLQVTVNGGHALLANEPITITGTTNYNGTYIVSSSGLTASNFVVTKSYVADDATGSARRPGTLKCLVAGIYDVGFTFSGVAENANDVFKWELNKDATALDNISARAVWTAGTNYRSVGASGLCSLSANQYVWASVKNYSGTGDVTFTSGNVKIKRLM